MEATRLLIAPVTGNDASRITSKGSILSLRHPKSGARTNYRFIDGALQEFQWFKQSYGSWFIGDYICEDGSLYITTPVDSIFILLPIFEVARMKKGNDAGMFRQLEEILFVDGYPGYQHLMSMAENCMHLVCEIKEIRSSKFYRLDNSKVLAWLCHKVHHLEAVLEKLDKNYAVREGDQLRDAVSLLREYLEEPLFMLLCSHLKVNIEVHSKEPKNEFLQISSESTPNAFQPTQVKNQNGKNLAGSGNKSKKQKTQTDSQNIKDMFHKASRRGSK
ncbi:hypothetical protein J5N97_007824 [Dioscorea zingiberensis]|uniref:Ribonuclease H2 subunit B n=1 Tax=Dioscorea zingiberensis TaxID=325984 RepID=A0A9D5DEB0_9LILI|nr:hypothetical protein J5N97_007824 [Dioscorea zingiberensis]